jgi:hypothetical protein
MKLHAIKVLRLLNVMRAKAAAAGNASSKRWDAMSMPFASIFRRRVFVVALPRMAKGKAKRWKCFKGFFWELEVPVPTVLTLNRTKFF